MMRMDGDLPEGFFPPMDVDAYRSLARNITGGVIVEVGVWLGRSLAAIAPICRDNGTELIAVDPWRADPGTINMPAVTFDPFEVFTANMAALGLADSYRAIRLPSVEAATQFQPKSVDMVFVDGDHSYASVSADLAAWSATLKPEGILAGHDYSSYTDVRRAVSEFARGYGRQVFRMGGDLWKIG